jgi:hypothetical protein
MQDDRLASVNQLSDAELIAGEAAHRARARGNVRAGSAPDLPAGGLWIALPVLREALALSEHEAYSGSKWRLASLV